LHLIPLDSIPGRPDSSRHYCQRHSKPESRSGSNPAKHSPGKLFHRQCKLALVVAVAVAAGVAE